MGPYHTTERHVWLPGTLAKNRGRVERCTILRPMKLTINANESTETYHIYMTDNSRISIAGLNERNVKYVATAIAACVRKELLQDS